MYCESFRGARNVNINPDGEAPTSRGFTQWLHCGAAACVGLLYHPTMLAPVWAEKVDAKDPGDDKGGNYDGSSPPSILQRGGHGEYGTARHRRLSAKPWD
jgi:hypothetical protein